MERTFDTAGPNIDPACIHLLLTHLRSPTRESWAIMFPGPATAKTPARIPETHA